jgi:hypothetical protein
MTIEQDRSPDRGPAMWWVVDRSGRVISEGFTQRAGAKLALACITALVSSELERLGHGRRTVLRRLSGYGIGRGPRGSTFRPHPCGARRAHGDRMTTEDPALSTSGMHAAALPGEFPTTPQRQQRTSWS